jgi:hypothetical protein
MTNLIGDHPGAFAPPDPPSPSLAGLTRLARSLVVAAAALALLPGSGLAQQASTGTAGRFDPPAVLWKDPGPIADRDLFWGQGSADRAPQGPFTFVEEDDGGTQPKIVVTDARGVTWDVKFGEEVKAEIAANRFVWALGFATEEMYFVRTGVVRNHDRDGRAAGFLSRDGNFLNARFRHKDPAIVRTDEDWTLRKNPFVGGRELSGLMTLMTLLANWDIGGTRNTKVLRVTDRDGPVELRYAVTDLGASFGRMGGRLASHSKWKLADYDAEGFVEKVEGEELHLDYDGLEPGVDHIPIEHARWFASLLAQLTPAQVRRAFEAAGATPDEVEGFTKRVVEKIAELQAAVGTGTPR